MNKQEWVKAKWKETKGSARTRNLLFELSAEQVESIIFQPCHYCGANFYDENDGEFCNGIDRKDNSDGYIFENCLPCCWHCNKLKGVSHYDDFIAVAGVICTTPAFDQHLHKIEATANRLCQYQRIHEYKNKTDICIRDLIKNGPEKNRKENLDRIQKRADRATDGFWRWYDFYMEIHKRTREMS